MNIISLHITSSMLVYYHRFAKKTVPKHEMPVLNFVQSVFWGSCGFVWEVQSDTSI